MAHTVNPDYKLTQARKGFWVGLSPRVGGGGL